MIIIGSSNLFLGIILSIKRDLFLVCTLDPQPTVTALIRGPFGRVVWTMQLRHLPRHKSSAKLYTVNPGRPLPMNDVGIKHSVKPKYFPDSVDRIPLSKA